MADGSEERAGAAVPSAPASAPADGSFAPFRFRHFREVWMANVLSQVGSQIQLVGAGWLMTELTTEHKLVAAVQSATMLTMLFFAVLAGAIADNYDRRRIMLLSQWSMLTVSAALALMTWQGLMTPWILLGFTLAVGAGMTLQMPAWHASVRVLVEPRVLPQAISLNSVSFNLARTVGPAIGGMVLAFAGVSAAFAINAFSYIAMILVLIRWRPVVAPPPRGPLLPSMREGLVHSMRSQPLRHLLLRGAGYSTGAIAVQALMPVVVREMLHGTERDFGALVGAFGVGSVVGALFAAAVRRRWGSEVALGAATAFSAIGLTGLVLTTSVPCAILLVLLPGAGWTMCLTTMNVGTQLRAPEEMLGRSMSIYQAVTLGAAAIAAWFWGTLADLADVRTALGAAAVYLVVIGLVLRVVSPLPARGEGVLLVRR